ncbi:hypothetical protein [Chelatococcus asaccharovorans]|uniref:hypothetical protein n=1 Tax=Chelatococcus asaccharovorans TaxID=28210 RepID=UPI0011B64732|nr:hypothetical protein [Chelatococcus asaccharovorans]MBS7703132.1 hypothetical protein [Chelatococcus asaccharovorans]
MTAIADLELAVLSKCLSDIGVESGLEFSEYATLVAERRFTRAGFFTDYKRDVRLQNKDNIKIKHWARIGAKINFGAFDAGFIVFLRDGYIEFLEGYVYEGTWPSNISEYSLYIIP